MVKITEGAMVLCTVKKIEKTTVFLNIEENGEGSMVLSEVAAGRIRNLREYVAPNKKIVCKVLKVEDNQIELSLRRVTKKEKEEVLERYKKERSIQNMLKTLVNNPEEVIKKIKEKSSLADFFEEAKENNALLNEFFNETEAEKIKKALAEKAEVQKEVKNIFRLSSDSPSGVIDIKEVLSLKDAKIYYLGSSTYSITVKADNFKNANKKMEEIIKEMQNRAKSKKMLFELK